ncbi:MAG: DUF1501 domain-containing protein [Hyphomonadaceae bacterium]|nr:DUF1501 domain-containing protein [Hyphomonadaceae bacterium]
MLNRRHFLKNIGASGAVSFAAGTGILSALGNANAYAADVGGYKALVCLFFRGGQDSFDTVLPYDQTSYDTFSQLRPGLFSNYAGQNGGSSRDRSRLLALNPTNAADLGSRQFALPEALSPLKNLFDSGDAAILGNVGPLIEPISREEYQSKSKPRPNRLFSHNDQQSTWVSSSTEGETIGWGGKLADAINASNANVNPAFSAVSASGRSTFLSGQFTQPYALSSGGPVQVNGLKNRRSALLGTGSENDKAIQMLEDHYRASGAQRPNLFERDIASISDKAFTSNNQYRSALESATELTTEFPNNSLGRQLRDVASSINVKDALGMSRQVFFATMGGFDTHDNQATNLANRHTQYAEAIAAFHAATVEMGIQNDVTLFTASDFGRTLIDNGDGTDHGWGAHHFIVGGGVQGNAIYGEMPEYNVDTETDAGKGRLIPTTSVEQYAATLGKWFGLSDPELLSALPALSNFTTRDLGFMANGTV